MNYSLPVFKVKEDINKNLNNKYLLNDILDQQIIISQLSKGGITFSDTDNMDEYERTYVLNKLIKLRKEEIEAKEKAIKNNKK